MSGPGAGAQAAPAPPRLPPAACLAGHVAEQLALIPQRRRGESCRGYWPGRLLLAVKQDSHGRANRQEDTPTVAACKIIKCE
jgi:hypothetical protein